MQVGVRDESPTGAAVKAQPPRGVAARQTAHQPQVGPVIGNPDSSKHLVLATLSYYLTFIRYFGFSINPADQRAETLTGSVFVCLAFSLLGRALKVVAISFTTFLAANHFVVLIDYFLKDTKTFMELLIEIRLALTKFSALIFVLNWHCNQRQVRRLIRLVKSTCLYILGASSSRRTPRHLSWAMRSRSVNLDDTEPEAELEPDNELGRDWAHRRLAKLDSSILRWWLMCVCVTMLHFSVSEAELLRSHHLWQWLDDYSLHTLTNSTVSESTLMFLVSLDNYIYTVHVYGTRLFGASIICIVCSIQSESIRAIELQALRLVRASPWSSSWWSSSWSSSSWSSSSSLSNSLVDLSPPCKLYARCHNHRLGVAASCAIHRHLDQIYLQRQPRPTLHQQPPAAHELFILAERDWPLDTDRAPPKWSWPRVGLVERFRRLIAPPLGLIMSRLEHLAARHYVLSSRQSSLSDCSRCSSRLADHLQLVAGPTVAPEKVQPPPTRSSPATPTSPRASFDGWPRSIRPTAPELAPTIERHLERLVTRYELVCSVNGQIEACFGPMLLIQYSFLFLMSCIDVVFFSISFNPNTKTKCIIVSGMILLWWPYLLLYQYSSDLGYSSVALLQAVKRLARLSLVENHQEQAALLELDQLPDLAIWPRQPSHPKCLSLRCDRSMTWTCRPEGRFETRRFQPAEALNAKSIINKLDHLFEPAYLSLLGIMKVDKFFLLNFAKIVITASVMMIQFISN